jgi:peptidoglycan/LPS O-acetylase OafA/YrhL
MTSSEGRAVPSPLTKLRVPALDLARLLAATAVVIFHFGFHGGVTHRYLDAYSPALGVWTRYGYLGVDVFFVISGFVIAWSAQGARALDFAWRRWLRVYPTFIFCVLLSSLVIVLARDPHFEVTLRQLLAHVIIDPRRFRIPFIDGVYWTIVCEVQFYVFVAIGLSIPWLRKHKTACILAWYALTLLNEYGIDSRMLRYAFVTQWSSFFILGMMLFRLKIRQFSRIDALLAVASFGTGMQLELRDARQRFLIAPDYSALAVALVLGSAIALLIYSAQFRFRPSVEAALRQLGSVSYPLYLIHGTIGYIVINRLVPRVGLLGAIALTITFVVGLASFVAFVVEPRLKAACSRLLVLGRSRLLPVSPVMTKPGVLSAPAETQVDAFIGRAK